MLGVRPFMGKDAVLGVRPNEGRVTSVSSVRSSVGHPFRIPCAHDAFFYTDSLAYVHTTPRPRLHPSCPPMTLCTSSQCMPQGVSNSVFERVFIEDVQLFVRTVAKSPPPVLPQSRVNFSVMQFCTKS